MKITLTMECSEDFQVEHVLNLIAEEIAMEEESGDVRLGETNVTWKIDEDGETVEVDRRQLHVAALMLMGFDLPQEMMASARSMIAASKIMPKATVQDIMPGNRKDTLLKAKSILDEMIGELDGK
jgi:hypothetical protein